MGNKKFSYSDLARVLIIALAGYLANVFGLVNLPSPY